MARYIGPKHRLSRRENTNLQGKTSASLSRRLNVIPGSHGTKGRPPKVSDYGKQLREKQKAKRTYGLMEKQFRGYFDKAIKVKGKTGEALLQLLEKRLDNCVFRLGFVPSRTMARQLVSHGHVLVDGKRVTIPSYDLKVNQVISLGAKAMNMPAVIKLLEAAETKTPPYMEKQAAVGRLIKVPGREEISTDVNEQLIIEY